MKDLVYLYLDSSTGASTGSLVGRPSTRGRIPESTLSGDLKVHYAPGALTNVVRKGRGFGGNHSSLIRAVGIYRLQGSTFEVKKHSKSICDTVRVFVFPSVCFKLIMGRVGGAWNAVWTAQA